MPEIAYLDFDLEVERDGAGYRVEVNSPAGQSSGLFALPFADLESENFLLRIGQSRRVMRRIDAPETEAAKAFGARLFDAVFAGEARACLRGSLDEAGRQGKGLRIRLRLNDTPELAGLPWEYLYNSSLNHRAAVGCCIWEAAIYAGGPSARRQWPSLRGRWARAGKRGWRWQRSDLGCRQRPAAARA